MMPELKHLPLSTSEKNRKRSMISLSMQDKTHLWTIHLAIPSFHGLVVLRPVPFFISSRHHCPSTDSMAMTVRARMMVATRIKRKDSRDGKARYNASANWYLNPFEKHFTKVWKFLVDWGAPFFLSKMFASYKTTMYFFGGSGWTTLNLAFAIVGVAAFFVLLKVWLRRFTWFSKKTDGWDVLQPEIKNTGYPLEV